MPLVPFNMLMADAEQSKYAVGYFESWNLESLLAVADAAEVTRSPVLLGFSGIFHAHPDRSHLDPLGVYAGLGLEVGRNLNVPASLVFNESPDFGSVLEAIDLGFGLVMYSDDHLETETMSEKVRSLVSVAHETGVAVEGELSPLPGVGGNLEISPLNAPLSDPLSASRYVEATGVDAFAVNVGQMHVHGRRQTRLNLDRLEELHRVIPVPLVLHGATSVPTEDLKSAIRLGVHKINVGSRLKQSYLNALRVACARLPEDFNPYEAIGSGLPADVLMAGRVALQRTVEDLMLQFGSAGKA